MLWNYSLDLVSITLSYLHKLECVIYYIMNQQDKHNFMVGLVKSTLFQGDRKELMNVYQGVVHPTLEEINDMNEKDYFDEVMKEEEQKVNYLKEQE